MKLHRNFFYLEKKERAVLLVVLAALLLGCWLPERLIVSISPSLSSRIFFLIKMKGVPKRGDYLVFWHSLPENIRHNSTKNISRKKNPLIKKVGCLPGDLLQTNGRGVFCNGKPLGVPLNQDSEGNLLLSFHFNGIVPDDSYYMIGSHPRSFDSRYFGFVHEQEIFHKALPLW